MTHNFPPIATQYACRQRPNWTAPGVIMINERHCRAGSVDDRQQAIYTVHTERKPNHAIAALSSSGIDFWLQIAAVVIWLLRRDALYTHLDRTGCGGNLAREVINNSWGDSDLRDRTWPVAKKMLSTRHGAAQWINTYRTAPPSWRVKGVRRDQVRSKHRKRSRGLGITIKIKTKTN